MFKEDTVEPPQGLQITSSPDIGVASANKQQPQTCKQANKDRNNAINLFQKMDNPVLWKQLLSDDEVNGRTHEKGKRAE